MPIELTELQRDSKIVLDDLGTPYVVHAIDGAERIITTAKVTAGVDTCYSALASSLNLPDRELWRRAGAVARSFNCARVAHDVDEDDVHITPYQDTPATSIPAFWVDGSNVCDPEAVIEDVVKSVQGTVQAAAEESNYLTALLPFGLRKTTVLTTPTLLTRSSFIGWGGWFVFSALNPYTGDEQNYAIRTNHRGILKLHANCARVLNVPDDETLVDVSYNNSIYYEGDASNGTPTLQTTSSASFEVIAGTGLIVTVPEVFRSFEVPKEYLDFSVVVPNEDWRAMTNLYVHGDYAKALVYQDVTHSLPASGIVLEPTAVKMVSATYTTEDIAQGLESLKDPSWTYRLGTTGALTDFQLSRLDHEIAKVRKQEMSFRQTSWRDQWAYRALDKWRAEWANLRDDTILSSESGLTVKGFNSANLGRRGQTLTFAFQRTEETPPIVLSISGWNDWVALSGESTETIKKHLESGGALYVQDLSRWLLTDTAFTDEQKSRARDADDLPAPHSIECSPLPDVDQLDFQSNHRAAGSRKLLSFPELYLQSRVDSQSSVEKLVGSIDYAFRRSYTPTIIT